MLQQLPLYPSLILVGATILLVMCVLLYQARRQARVNLELVKLNENLRFDLPDLLRECWSPLAQAGFIGLSWQLDWFGTRLAGQKGDVTGEGLVSRHLEAGEISLDVTLSHGGQRWEQRYFSDSLAENFFLLLHVDMWIKMGAVQGAFGQAAKLKVFLQHDMKNIAQFIRLAAEQLENVAPEHEARLLTTLRAAMPTVRVRAERILGNLSRQMTQVEKHTWSLTEVWRQVIEMHGLTATIQGSGSVFMAEEVLLGILDNLVVNYADQIRRVPDVPPSLLISVLPEDGRVHSVIQDVHGHPCLRPERLFEPFWSDQSDGLGIGLYQARQLAVAAGGSLEVQLDPERPLVFVLNLPGT